jgi:hypothetical protein
MRRPSQISGAVGSLFILISVIVCLLIIGCATHQLQRSENQGTHNAQQAHTSPQSVPLFVHLISPRYYTDPPIPPKRIVTTRVRLGKDFAVALGDPGSSHSYSVGGQNPFSYSGDAVLFGRIERRGTAYWGHLLGLSHTTLNNFAGEMELGKPVESQGAAFSGAIWSVRFVISTNADCSPFLKE